MKFINVKYTPCIVLACLVIFTYGVILVFRSPYNVESKKISTCLLMEFYLLGYSCRELEVLQQVQIFEVDGAREEIYILAQPSFAPLPDDNIANSNDDKINLDLEVSLFMISRSNQIRLSVEKAQHNVTFSCLHNIENKQLQCSYGMWKLNHDLNIMTTYLAIIKIANHHELTKQGMASLKLGLVSPNFSFSGQLLKCNWILFLLSIGSVIMYMYYGDYYHPSDNNSNLVIVMSLWLVIFNIPYLNLSSYRIPINIYSILIKSLVYSIQTTLLTTYWMMLLTRLTEYGGLIKHQSMIYFFTLGYFVISVITFYTYLVFEDKQNWMTIIHLNNWTIALLLMLAILCLLTVFELRIVLKKLGKLESKNIYFLVFALWFLICYTLFSVKINFGLPLAKEVIYIIITICVLALRLLHSRKALEFYILLPSNLEQ